MSKRTKNHVKNKLNDENKVKELENNNDQMQDIIYANDSNEVLSNPDIDDEEDDEFDRHFGDNLFSNDISSKIGKINNKQWNISNYKDPILKSVSEYSTEQISEVKENVGNSELNLSSLKIKEKLLCSWKKLNESNDSVFTELQTGLFHHINKYRDVLFTNRSVENSKEIRQIYALHALNHVFKEFRDQGFTRPKVLILLPFRNSALNLAEIIIKLSGTEQQENRKRFFDSYGISPDEEKIDINKPETFKGNIDDMFRIGIKLTRKSIKFYAEFYNADIILASPLGLRMIIGNEGDRKHDFDFLSSIEILIIDQCEIFLMQNWDHIGYIFNHLNLIPKKSHNCDFSRVKNWYLDGKAKYFRQTIMISSYLTPEINSLFNKQMLNIAGKLKIKDQYEGTIVDVIPQIKQIFTRVECQSLIEADDARFKHFIEKSLPALQKLNPKLPHTLIFIPSYFDFIRIRNYFEDYDYNFTSICEYTSAPDVTRARSNFLNGKRNIMLYTERFYFFRR
ncbi:24001_t:CDS:10 [Dentiscutata erythropus]|uniref:U3 small nucleolar RNA-associated protein 25 n=1 Tax=Dentiscutata erythropus TaxID=1348616 RepID=A0A9N8YUV6_9GLOM|nr:24001_t:CDS:10 [Dentiscutata erythropus]